MLLHTDPLYKIFFGDTKTQYINCANQKNKKKNVLFAEWPFAFVKKKLRARDLIFLQQVHSATGVSINTDEQLTQLEPFTHRGDFIVTNLPHIGIGVATADCVPIVLFDPIRRVISVIHAGWRGSLEGVACNALTTMKKKFSCVPEHIRVFFGPSVTKQSYIVGDEVIKQVSVLDCAEDVLQYTHNNVYFDLPLFNRIMLEQMGIKKDAFHLNYNYDTITESAFCSYRAHGERTGKNLTIAMLT